jgi:hypothetical protein
MASIVPRISGGAAPEHSESKSDELVSEKNWLRNKNRCRREGRRNRGRGLAGSVQPNAPAEALPVASMIIAATDADDAGFDIAKSFAWWRRLTGHSNLQFEIHLMRVDEDCLCARRRAMYVGSWNYGVVPT